MLEELKNLEHQAAAQIAQAADDAALEALRVYYLGRKGTLTKILRSLRELSPELRPQVGQEANRIKQALEQALSAARERLQEEARQRRRPVGLDVTLPGRRPPLGRLHPITRITREICDIFVRLGFEVVEGPEVETDYYNFEALNIPKDHPARDMQDTFYVSENIVLRTHTSPMQIRVMEKQPPPVRIIAPGKTYRRDSDLTHTPMFHQVEALLVDKHITFADLKGVLRVFVHEIFDPSVGLRFRPSYFPFTEPSAEVDIACVICRGAGCRVCKETGWLEVIGAGMVHPEVFRFVGYDPEVYTGFAFGMGIERIAMLKYGIDDLRLFFENDLRFLRQF
ncbi:MAG: phenylalanine--tRNA ligase subunit alpha [Deltaproteobacteria bacterium]|nr:phenylalanine--tRNA ligase subunit alpha [Deltaproteobacteria bacterium]MBW1951701.1 phenylalanine--tRNA ligase subunit alpha [Deltaproteobacteria bacterium]MBW1987572.1 phenylalanine--tRNA ligase subunit alpha [Deltaproteobacteria bacterium]MBW2134714.1 phenylalanine--tRNA ligase subunit alpha [Deltaproteobacteria bacterium]